MVQIHCLNIGETIIYEYTAICN